MPKFLIVDDDRACRELLKEMLSPRGACDTAPGGLEAIEAFQKALRSGEPYDLIFLDIMMPGMDGHAVLNEIREIEKRHSIAGLAGTKVVMTTALRDAKHCMRAFREGCESYVTKPFRESQLLVQVESLLAEIEQATKPAGPASARAGESSESAPGATPATTEPSASARPRFLLVDDEEVCRELLQEMLSPYGDCDYAYDGDEAINAVRLAIEDGAPYGLICLDIMLPGMSGHEALHAIRQVEAEHNRPGSDGAKVIMTTALRDAKHCIRAFREGCECYLTKPFREEQLRKTMSELGFVLQEVRSH